VAVGPAARSSGRERLWLRRSKASRDQGGAGSKSKLKIRRKPSASLAASGGRPSLSLSNAAKEPGRGADFTDAAADPRGARTDAASRTTRESEIAGAYAAAEVPMPPSVRVIGLTASSRFEPDSRLVTVAELDTCRLQGSS
jgi:hypothetical protein